ncbi:MAG: serine/threonine-protein kinase [Aureliella sp.]
MDVDNSETLGDDMPLEFDGTIEASFAQLELCLSRLADISPVTAASEIVGLIPAVSETARRLFLAELIKFDLAKAAESGQRRSLDFYWPTVGAILPHERIPFDLVLEEVHLRKEAGERPSWEDYRQRFPDLAATIGRWLAGGQTASATSQAGKVPELAENSLVDDFYILSQLGRGAFARVYLARQESMQRLVALKATSRGSEEPQALSQLDHPNIVRVYDQRAISDPPTILLYMQYLAGGTLAECVKRRREQALPASELSGQILLDAIDKSLLDASQSVPEQSSVREQVAEMTWPETVAWIGVQLADGLGYASSKGVLHRDVKPANILLSGEAIPKLADFNVSCTGLSGRAGAAAYFGGSLAYMSPEQLDVANPMSEVEAASLDGRSDLYALGIVLWELWQGQRPWQLSELAPNWSQAVSMQREVRSEPLVVQHPSTTAVERVLEKVLRSLLHVSPEQRPQTGSEAKARLQLALHPELAHRFEPAPRSMAGRLLRIPVILIALLVIFGPNTAASVFNYAYNHSRMKDIDPAFQDGAAEQARRTQSAKRLLIPGIEEDFRFVANMVNAIVFPLGGVLFLTVVWPIAKILARARENIPPTVAELSRLLHAGNHATLVCGILWSVSGVVFATSFASMHSEFDLDDAFHFFISLVLCGGVAWIYPYFGMTLLSLLVYYPKAVSISMHDPQFNARSESIRQQMRWYLLSAAAIPLAAIGLLVFSEQEHALYIQVGVVLTGLGLYASFVAHQKLDETLSQLDAVLGSSPRR